MKNQQPFCQEGRPQIRTYSETWWTCPDCGSLWRCKFHEWKMILNSRQAEIMRDLVQNQGYDFDTALIKAQNQK